MPNMKLTKNPMPSQPADVRSGNFDEVALGYTAEMAIDEAQRCLNCKHKPCVGGCPVRIDIPAFIAKVADGDFEAAYQEYGEELKMVAIDGLEYREAMVEFLEGTDYTFPIAYDADGAVNMLYPSDGIPYTVIIDGDGVVQNTYVGALDAEKQYETYKTAIDELLEKEK